MKSANVLSRKYVNRTFVFSPKDIINDGLWISGDYVPIYHCLCWNYYHTCYTNRDLGFKIVLEQARDGERYPEIYNEIKNQGFSRPLSSIISPDNEAIILVDGHHRLAVALDLNLKKIPIYVASTGTSLDDLVAYDSAVWTRQRG
jgi:hypothetical protein